LEAVLAAAQSASGIVVWNPAPAPTQPVSGQLFEAVDVLVPNQTELAVLVGYDGPVDTDSAAGLAASLTVKSVVVTLGSSGALVMQDGSATHVPAPVVEPLDSTAAGDSFCAALADRLVGGEDLVAATRWAVQVGAATTLRVGAQPSLPTPAEVHSLLATEK